MAADKKPLAILIAIRSNILAEGLRLITETNPFDRRVSLGKCSQGENPDIILFDNNQDIRALQTLYPGAKAILLDTGLKERDISRLLVSNNLQGVISPEASIEMFHKAIRAVDQGEIWVDQKQLKALLQRNNTMTRSGAIRSLSPQDLKIVQLIGQGCRNRQIADKLCLSEHTIKAHVSRIFKLMNVSNRAQLVSLSKEEGV